MAEETDVPNNPFILLLHGLYHPVVHGPKLGLSLNLDDGSYSKTRIYPIFGILESNDQDRPIGTFYPEATLANGQVTFNPPGNPGFLCAYDLPGGAIAMQFAADYPARTKTLSVASGPSSSGGRIRPALRIA